MDKVILSKTQLKELRDFIDSRGFHDPIVIMEILDHFACKVEEKMTDNPNLPFTDAMYEAHADFGRMGFWYIAAKAEKEQMYHGSKTFARHFKKLVFNPLNVVLMILAGLLFFNLYVQIQPLEWGILEGADFMKWAYLLVYVIAFIVIFRRIPKVYKQNHMYSGTSNYLLNNKYSWAFYWMVMILPGRPGTASVTGFGIFAAVVLVFLCVHSIAYYRTVNSMINHYNTVQEAFAGLSEQ
ncbi:MAG: hypothetical protein H6551_03765 [Chitinophagales bacterium]|nr:hypothetical protein [Chitinophagaceae bacterium]MCB9064240.1 hypothetical protein [Chitinophagales bacterium]